MHDISGLRPERRDQARGKKLKLRKFISSIPFLACLTESQLTSLEQVILERSFARGDIILLEEDTCNHLYVVYSGKVKAVKIDSQGREHILAIHKKGEYFGEMGILDGKTSPAAVVAMEDVEIGLISRKDFEAHLLTNPDVLREIVAVFCKRIRESWLKLKVLSYTGAGDRVREVLGILASHHGVKDQRGVILPLRLTHKDIAQYASLSRETVTRQLDKLARNGEIEILENRCILLMGPFLAATKTLPEGHSEQPFT